MQGDAGERQPCAQLLVATWFAWRGEFTISVTNAATVDVEDWHALYHGYLTGEELPPTEHVVVGTQILLDLFARNGVTGTFFVTGPCAVTFPPLVREIVAAGHEIACHGWAHRPISTFTPETFRADLKRALGALEDVTGAPVQGYRAPFFSIGPSETWALDIVAELGFQYDSSLSPLRFAAAGRSVVPGLHRLPADGPGTSLVELPMSTAHWLGKQRNIGGGRWFRLLPCGVILNGFQQLSRLGIVAQTYTHSYEVLPYRLRLPGPLRGLSVRAKAYLLESAYAINRQQTATRLAAVLQQCPRWAPIRAIAAEFLAPAATEGEVVRTPAAMPVQEFVPPG